MKVVVDENVSHSLTPRLAGLGYEVIVVGADIASGSSDDVVFGKVVEAKGLLITRDYHFTNPARFDSAKTHERGGVAYRMIDYPFPPPTIPFYKQRPLSLPWIVEFKNLEHKKARS